MLQELQNKLKDQCGATDIYSNSKIYEIIIANELKHTPIAGHSGTRNGKTENGEFEYKHYKESSSNHSWTFNDYSDNVINDLKNAKSVIFTHIDDKSLDKNGIPKFDWYIEISGNKCSNYLKERTQKLLKEQPKGKPNARKMINFSPNQLKKDLGVSEKIIKPIGNVGQFTSILKEIHDISNEIEKITGIKQILTSNKFWEMLVSLHLEHQILSEQSGHDAKDSNNNYYEYKVAIASNWNFQDISEKVLAKYSYDNKIILATVDKEQMIVKTIYQANPDKVIKVLKEKLNDKKIKYAQTGKELRRLAVSLSKGNLQDIDAVEIPLKKF